MMHGCAVRRSTAKKLQQIFGGITQAITQNALSKNDHNQGRMELEIQQVTSNPDKWLPCIVARGEAGTAWYHPPEPAGAVRRMGSGVSVVAPQTEDDPEAQPSSEPEPERVLETRGMVKLESYGYANDGQWHHLSIPLEDFAVQGVDLARVGSPMILVGGAGEPGESAWIDAVYYTAD